MCGGVVEEEILNPAGEFIQGEVIDPFTEGGGITDTVADQLGLGTPLEDAGESVGGFIDDVSGETAREQAQEASEALQQGAQSQIEYFENLQERMLGLTGPYREAGLEFLPQYTQLLSPEGSAAFKANYLESDEFKAAIDKGTENLLQILP